MSSSVIVLVEDDPKLRKLYSDYLEVDGFAVAAAKDGIEALGPLHGITPVVLILDIMMPNTNGVETCRQVRKIIGADVPIMLLTAAENLDKVKERVEAGGDDYLMKTGSLDCILERINHLASASAQK